MQPAHVRIHVRYKGFQKDQRDIWESFCIVDFYGQKIKDAVKENTLPPLEIDRVWNESSSEFSVRTTLTAL